ncbi:bifunctional folylpolyglutamate synthase/dihydrofolate synthase [Pontivivens ytuae]|uniref:Dihydrofolate synthase/folylpolyglutamate synthase n=1 Tax=Pontivivens ytuae TaxID=2789856 RepID=A0A7S9LPQ9_9RHOB|nr:folylpolyglutamate synthase/dihydrofolate synthase family protein [Pontivivens ytuae]QPH52879.1 bifunctional folylpolyglutamate synthase/dihydrofolate synthase [Pontivivens ytuae]
MSAPTSDAVLQRLMSLHPKVIDLTLDRMERLLAALGHPERDLPPVVHVAGTNGKGSTIAMMRAGLESAGQRVSVYTSPHLARFHERIRLPDGLIGEADLMALLEECEAVNGGAPITYFEITTCAAFLAFARTPADYLLLEVGLGGRLDATNVVDRPALSIITPVSLDHQQFLGERVEQIAGEKAGILKRGVPAVIARQSDAARAVIEARAEAVGAPLTIGGQDWDVYEDQGRLAFFDQDGLLDLPMPNLIGAHQVQNAGTALAGLRMLGFDEAACEAAVTRAEWPARMQRLRHGPLVEAAGDRDLWLDGGHNVAAGEALAEALGRLPARPLHVICGMMNTKDAKGFLTPLARIAGSLQAVAVPGEANAADPEALAAAASEQGMEAAVAPGVASAVDAAPPDARLLICGSLYLAGYVLRENG